MRKYIMMALFGLLISHPAYANNKVNVFACEPEWASLTKEIGGDKVKPFAATSARQDPHHVRAKPSLIAAMRRADLVVCSGAGLEIGWLPILLEKAGNTNTRPGSNGNLIAASYVPVLEKPTRLDRADGDVHPEGNPHVHLNPHNIALVAKELTSRLSEIDPVNAAFYQSNYDNFIIRWNTGITKWEKQAASLTGKEIVVHHKSFAYLLDWLDMQEVASLEPKPGLPPTTAHLEMLLQKLKPAPAAVSIRTPYEPNNASQWLSEKTGIPAIVLPFTIKGNEQSSDLFGLLDSTITLLKEAINAK